MTKRFATSLLLLLIVCSIASAVRVERLIDTWQPKHYVVSLTLNDQLSEIVSGSARIDVLVLKKTSLIDLDFGELRTSRVTVDSKPASFTHKNGKLAITLAEPANPGTKLVVEVTYSGKPKDGLIMSADKDGKPSAVGDNWPNRVHHWIPTFDHPSAKATVTFNITAPAREEVVANGKLDRVETTGNGTRTWTYSEGAPIPPYCMIIAVGQFARIEPSQRAPVPISYYVPKSESHLALKGFAPTIPSLEYFNELIAPYPYEKLAMIVGATRYGGMENSSAIVFTAQFFNVRPQAKLSAPYGIPRGTVNLISHEIAHQWFGDSVTESTWADLWLSEGFATYFAGLFLQRSEGEAAFQDYMSRAAEEIFEYEKKKPSPIFDRDTEDLLALLNANNYQKGAWVLHMLRSSLGDQVFFRGIRDYYHKHKEATATTEDLRAALENASGKDLSGFFKRWIYESGHPKYQLSWEWRQKSEVRLVLRQLQSGNAFLDHVPVAITTTSGKREVILKPAGKEIVETVRLNEMPASIAIDPGNTLLKEATVVKP
ncbi:MAG TPA: M1 family metallopeptidase [Pyrinomonadaceae bacterium]|nr:M1 family metallopeptidase [Pyrinomonadaceae bacterium]